MDANSPPSVSLTYLGGPTLLIEIGQLRLLSDPTFDGAGNEYFHGPLRLVKLDPSPRKPADLGRIDAVLLSHDQHADNLDCSGRAFLCEVGQVVTTPESAIRLGHNALGLETWERIEITDALGNTVSITATPAQHGPDGTQEMTGPVTGFLLEWPGQVYGPLYLSGDTVLFSGTDALARRTQVSMAILHLGRVNLPGLEHMSFSLGAAEGVLLANSLGARTLVPVHYEGWAHFSQPRHDAEREFAEAGVAERVLWLPVGEAVEVKV